MVANNLLVYLFVCLWTLLVCLFVCLFVDIACLFVCLFVCGHCLFVCLSNTVTYIFDQSDDDVVCQQRQQNLNEQTSISHSKPHPQTHPHSDNLNDWEMVEAPPKTEFDKFLLAAAINQAAQARVRRESGSEHGGVCVCVCVCVCVDYSKA